jgi:quercetin dioxygenase-like cupin family protein
MNIPELMCARRMQLRLTLTDLAKRSGLSVPFLSQVEKGQKGLSVSSLKSIADGLEVSMNYFLETETEDEHVHSVDDLHYFGLSGSKVRYARLGSRTKGRELEPMYVIIPPGNEPDKTKHAGEEFVHVLKGHLIVTIGKKRYELGPGNTIHYKSTVRHDWRNESSDDVHLISVTSMALF